MRTKLRIIFAFALLSISLCLMSNTYSRYVASTTGNVNTSFAIWQVLINNNDITNNNSSQITFTPTIIENKNVATNTVAPSSKGYFDIKIDPTNVDVSFNYSINLSVANKNMPDLLITKYAILDSSYIEGNEINYTELNNYVITNTMSFNNNIENFKFEPFTIRVCFEWYEGKDEKMNDEADTNVGSNAATDNTKFSIKANISFEQEL